MSKFAKGIAWVSSGLPRVFLNIGDPNKSGCFLVVAQEKHPKKGGVI